MAAHEHVHEEHADEVKLSPDAITRNGIKIEAARKQVLREIVTASGRVSFNKEAMAHVGSPLRGRAIDIKVKVGDIVKKGDALVVIESPELGEAQADYFLKRIAAESAAPTVELAKVLWERAKGLQEGSQGISLTEVQKREAEYKAAVAARRSAEAAAVSSRNRLQLLGMTKDGIDQLIRSEEVMPHYSITAPIEGRIVLREVTQGELVGPEKESVLVIADTRTLWILADVPDTKLVDIAKGAKAWIDVGSIDGKRIEGEVAFIAAHADATTRTVEARIEVNGEAMSLRPGMFAQVEIERSAGGNEAEIVIPEDAIQTVEGGPAVFVPVKDEANTFAKRAVSVGRRAGGRVVIEAGLVEGEEYVAAGTFILKAELGKGSAAHEH